MTLKELAFELKSSEYQLRKLNNYYNFYIPANKYKRVEFVKSKNNIKEALEIYKNFSKKACGKNNARHPGSGQIKLNKILSQEFKARGLI